MAIRYFIGLFFTLCFLVIICLLSGFGVNISMFVDIPSIIVVVIFPLIFIGILHGYKNIGTAFTIISNKEPERETLENAKTFFEYYSKTIFSISFIAFIISFMAMMNNLENKDALGPNMAIASILLLYAGIINMVIIIPYKIIIKIARIKK